MIEITATPLTAENFAPYGDVIAADGVPDKIINAGMCGRYHDRARLNFGDDGRGGISIFNAVPRAFPYRVDLVERHPDGSQAFIPMSENEWLIIVADDVDGTPNNIQAFVAAPGQAINFHRATWHGVLTPLHAPGLFAVVDRIGNTPNLEEFPLDPPYVVTI